MLRLWSAQQVAVCVVRRVQAAWAGQMRADAVDAALQRWGFGLAACGLRAAQKGAVCQRADCRGASGAEIRARGMALCCVP